MRFRLEGSGSEQGSSEVPEIFRIVIRWAGRRPGAAPDHWHRGPSRRPDDLSWQEVGIASANFSWRGEASPALLEPPYHSPEDTIEKNISLARLQVSLELIGSAAYATARRP